MVLLKYFSAWPMVSAHNMFPVTSFTTQSNKCIGVSVASDTLKCTRNTSGGAGWGDVIHPCLHEDREASRERVNLQGWFLAEAKEASKTQDLRNPLPLGTGLHIQEPSLNFAS